MILNLYKLLELYILKGKKNHNFMIIILKKLVSWTISYFFYLYVLSNKPKHLNRFYYITYEFMIYFF